MPGTLKRSHHQNREGRDRSRTCTDPLSLEVLVLQLVVEGGTLLGGLDLGLLVAVLDGQQTSLHAHRQNTVVWLSTARKKKQKSIYNNVKKNNDTIQRPCLGPSIMFARGSERILLPNGHEEIHLVEFMYLVFYTHSR